MKYILTDKQIDKILKPFFEEHFGNAVYSEWDEDGQPWEGFSKMNDGKRQVLLAYPLYDSENRWFSNGQYFNGWWNMFNLQPDEFNESMKRFVNKKYNMDINEID